MEYNNININNQIFAFEFQENKFINPNLNFQNILDFLQNKENNKNEMKQILIKLKDTFIEYKEIAQIIFFHLHIKLEKD